MGACDAEVCFPGVPFMSYGSVRTLHIYHMGGRALHVIWERGGADVQHVHHMIRELERFPLFEYIPHYSACLYHLLTTAGPERSSIAEARAFE